MSGTLYIAFNAAYPTTAAPVKVATGTAIKTMLQISTPASVAVRIVEWGISFDTPASASVIACELFGTTVGATSGTAITPTEYSSFSAVPSLTTTIWSPGTEGTVANYRPFDLQQIVPPVQYVKQWPLGREPQANLSQFVRVRVTASVTCNCSTYIIWEE